MANIIQKAGSAVSGAISKVQDIGRTANQAKNKVLIDGFYNLAPEFGGKSVLPSYKFLVYFINLNKYKEIADSIGTMPQIMPWHIKGIKIPRYQFQTQVQKIGAMPKGFSTLKYEEPLSIEVEFEEDVYGTIGFFGEWMMQTIINKDGLYRAPDKTKWGNIVVEVNGYNDIPVQYIIFEKCYFKQISELNLNYDTDTSVGYNMTFGCEHMKSIYVKPNLTKMINNLMPFSG